MNISFEEYKELRSKQRSASISEGLEKSYQQGMFKVANRKCFGYITDADGHLIIDPERAEIVRWIFDTFLCRNQLRQNRSVSHRARCANRYRRQQVEFTGNQRSTVQRKIYRTSTASKDRDC